MMDDTCYFLPFDDEKSARVAFRCLTSKQAISFFQSIIFWDEKRPIKKPVLDSLDLEKLASHLGEKLVLVKESSLKAHGEMIKSKREQDSQLGEKSPNIMGSP